MPRKEAPHLSVILAVIALEAALLGAFAGALAWMAEGFVLTRTAFVVALGTTLVKGLAHATANLRLIRKSLGLPEDGLDE